MAINTSTPRMSFHARTRCQQRSVPPLIVDWLVQFGAEVHDGHGAIIRHFDRAARRRLAAYAGWNVVSRLSEFLGAYVVTSGGVVITVGHRFRRISH